MPQNTYGRRHVTAAQRAAANLQCFVSSSPEKPEEVHEEHVDSEIGLKQQSSDQSKGRRDEANGKQRDNSVANMAVVMNGLTLRDSRIASCARDLATESPQTNSTARRKPRRALNKRDANIGAATGTSRGRGPRKDNVKTSEANVQKATNSAVRKSSIDLKRSETPAAGTKAQNQCITLKHEPRRPRQEPAQRPDEDVSLRTSPSLKKAEPNVGRTHQDSSPPARPRPPPRFHRRRPIAVPTIPPELTAHISPLIPLLTTRDSPLPFSTYASSLTSHLNISKIAEASYGEVYRLTPRDSDLASTLPTSGGRDSVLKVIALKPPPARPSDKAYTKAQRQRVNDMTPIPAMASELRLLRRMSTIPGFASFRAAHLLQGPLPPAFVSAWRTWNEDVKESEFPDPGKRGSGYLGAEQLWAVVEMVDAGKDLEEKVVEDVFELWDLFWGVAVALAKGEMGAGFEHRDLHLGNICVQYPVEDRPCQIDTSKKLGFTGLETTLIDYTLSRAEIKSASPTSPESAKPTAPDSGQESGEEETAYLDLSSPSQAALFTADASEEYQYEIYRYMRNAVLTGEPLLAPKNSSDALKTRRKQQGRRRKSGTTTNTTPQRANDREVGMNADPWRKHHPITNLIWLHFILHKLKTQLAQPFRAPPPPVMFDPKNGGVAYLETTLMDRVSDLEYELSLRGLGKRSKAWCIYEDHEEGDEVFHGAASLAQWAIVEKGWLTWEDVLGSVDVGDGGEEGGDHGVFGEMGALNL